MNRWWYILVPVAAVIGLAIVIRAVLGEVILGADLYTRWVGGNALIRGDNPYSSEVTLESQMGIYGRPAFPGEDQVAFAYPPHSNFLLLPVVWMPFHWAQAFWLALNLIVLVTSVTWVYPRSHLLLRFSLIFFYPLTLALILGNYSLTIGIILFIGYHLLTTRKNLPRKEQFLLGFLLALAAIKPQLTWLGLIFLLALAIRSEFRMVPIGFFGSLVLMSLGFWVLIPTWPMDWIRQVIAYTGYDLGDPVIYALLSIFLPDQAAVYASIVLAGLLVGLTVWFFRLWSRQKINNLTIFAWCGFITFILHPNGIAYDQIIFYLPLAIWAFQPLVHKARGFVLLWIGLLTLSWLAFVIGRWIYPPADALPVLIFGLWLLWYLRDPSRRCLVTTGG